MSLEQYRQQCFEKLSWATKQLCVEIQPSDLQKIAGLVVQTMTGPWRYFHTPDHIFEVGGLEDPIEVLAALFHDIVYVQVDQSIHFNLAGTLGPFIEQEQEQLRIRARAELPEDAIFELVMAIFGFSPGQPLLVFGGQNEFLSAIVAAKIYQPWLSPSSIAQIITCIEATIPFRPLSDHGLTCCDHLFQRLQTANTQYRLGLSDADMVSAILRSVRLANRDVMGFGGSTGHFLNNTWSLLPETNHHFSLPSSYTVKQYRISIQKMASFLEFLPANRIFQKFRHEPDDATYQGLIERATHNLAVGRLYLSSKLVAVAILEALSLRLGRDVALTTLMGNLPFAGDLSARTEDFLPTPPNPWQPKTPLETEVLELLIKGRTQESDYDVKNSPLATFLAQSIGFDAIRRQFVRAKNFFEGAIPPEEFLLGFRAEDIDGITGAIVRLFESRKAVLARPRPTQSHEPVRDRRESTNPESADPSRNVSPKQS